MRFKDYTIEKTQSEWCLVYKSGEFMARTINAEEARRYMATA